MHEPSPEKARVLVVDDDSGVRDTFLSLLEGPEWDVFAADSAKTALQTISKTMSPDVILLDIMMPEMDGLALCRLLKANPSLCHIPIILITALSDKKSVARGLDAGADDFLSKPVSGIELQARVRSMLRIKRNHDRLEEARRLRKDLSDLIVHDLRTPVSVVSGCVELLETHIAGNDHARTLLERIRFQAQRMDSFLTDLLLTAKLEAGRLQLSPIAVDIKALVQRAVDGFFPLAQSRNIALGVSLPEAEISWSLDEGLALRVLDNLLINALKFTPSGGQVHVSAGMQGAQLCIVISDTGPGIPPHLRERIFEPFSIVEARKSSTIPVGLGLAFCSMVVQAHGGLISVRDNAPQGSIFSVTFPKREKES